MNASSPLSRPDRRDVLRGAVTAAAAGALAPLSAALPTRRSDLRTRHVILVAFALLIIQGISEAIKNAAVIRSPADGAGDDGESPPPGSGP